jgi:Flp pilus assembly protein TadD
MEDLAIYIDGRSTPAERASFEDHLQHCEDCYELFIDSARTLVADAAETPGEVLQPAASPLPKVVTFDAPVRSRARLWTAGLAAAAAIAVVAWGALRFEQSAGTRLPPEFDGLVAAVRDTRPAEGRLAANFTYAPPPTTMRSAGTGRTLTPEVEAAVARLQQSVAGQSGTGALRSLGIAALVEGQLDAAVESLERAARSAPGDPAVLADLSAVYLERARQPSGNDDAQRAYDAASRAIQADPAMQAARFNLALALERLGRRAEAQQAWRDYLTVDSQSAWAQEARQRLDTAREPGR